MIGDWVKSKDKTVKINVARLFGMVYHYDSNATEEVQPIPLTEEMLLKNGFTSQYNDVVGISAIELTLTWDTDRWFANWGNIQIRYIHELQHLLRLCGLRDLADNFKVE